MSDPYDSDRLFFPATQRNVGPIGDVLSTELPRSGVVLELASGSGEHAIAFQQRFPFITWQPSDPEALHRRSINAWIDHKGLNRRMPTALNLNVLQRPWPLPSATLQSLSAVVCINLLHISPPECSQAVLEEAAKLLPREAPLIIYGPFKQNGVHTSASNASFDSSLRQRDQRWGIRDQEWIEQLADQQGLKLIDWHQMPANNVTIVLRTP